MALKPTLKRYRMTLALALTFGVPALLGFVFGFAGMTNTADFDGLLTLNVWAVIAWAVGVTAWELREGYRRRQSSESNDDPTPARV